MGVELQDVSLERAQIGQFLEAADFFAYVADVALQSHLVLEDVEGQQPHGHQHVLPAAHQILSFGNGQRSDRFAVELEHFGRFFGDGVVGGEDDLARLGAAGEQELVFGVEEGERGVLEEGGGFEGLIQVLRVDVEEIDVLVEEQQGQQLLIQGDGHAHDLAVMGHVQDHRKLNL